MGTGQDSPPSISHPTSGPRLNVTSSEKPALNTPSEQMLTLLSCPPRPIIFSVTMSYSLHIAFFIITLYI